MPGNGILAFDPGKRSAAWATLYNGELVRCGFIRWQDDEHPAELESRFRFAIIEEPLRVLVELPQIYGAKSRRTNPNDLVSVAVTCGRIAQALGACVKPELVWPHAWKGNVPGDTMTERIRSVLSASERVILQTAKTPSSLEHNVIDAIGLGLWASGRMRKR